MRTAFRKSFVRDVRKLNERRVGDQVRSVIEAVESAARLSDVLNLKMMSGAAGYYRVRIGDYRIGLFVEGEEVEFVRVLHRKEMYRHFP